MRAHTQTNSWANRQRVSTTFFFQIFLAFLTEGSNLGFLDLESDVLPIDPLRHTEN